MVKRGREMMSKFCARRFERCWKGKEKKKIHLELVLFFTEKIKDKKKII